MTDTGVLRPETVSANGNGGMRGLLAKASAVLSGAVGAVAGAAPHVLHHVGPLAGAALFTGAGGTAVFGVAGFALTIPMLIRLKRRFGTWLAPGIALALFVGMFTASAVWIGPAIRGDGGIDGQPTDHDSHHT